MVFPLYEACFFTLCTSENLFCEAANSDKDKDLEIHLDLKKPFWCMCTNFYRGIFMTALAISYLPPLCTLPGKLCKDNRFFRVLLFMLLATCLHEKCVCCHPATRLCISALSSSHLCCYLIILICILYVGLILLGGSKEREMGKI